MVLGWRPPHLRPWLCALPIPKLCWWEQHPGLSSGSSLGFSPPAPGGRMLESVCALPRLKPANCSITVLRGAGRVSRGVWGGCWCGEGLPCLCSVWSGSWHRPHVLDGRTLLKWGLCGEGLRKWFLVWKMCFAVRCETRVLNFSSRRSLGGGLETEALLGCDQEISASAELADLAGDTEQDPGAESSQPDKF